MCAGILVGAKCFPMQWKELNEKLQVAATVLLIFSMGVTLGRRENFLADLASMGVTAFVLFLLPAVCSTVLVYFVTRRTMKEHRKEDQPE